VKRVHGAYPGFSDSPSEGVSTPVEGMAGGTTASRRATKQLRKWQSRDMTPPASKGSFFAYPAKPALRAETMRHVITGLTERGTPATGWEDLEIDGRVLVQAITSRIDESTSVIAEISSMNFNVLFELGYAVARNKPTWLAFDETDLDAERAWNEVAIFATVGRTDYGGNAERLIARFLEKPPSATPPLAETILAGAKPREANAVFAPSLPIKLTAATTLERYLDRQTHLKILASSEDLLIAPLEFYVRELYRSSAVVLHLLGSQRRRSVEHNARASFLAGFAHGLELPTMMVVQARFETPLDYRDLLFEYDTSAALVEKTDTWLKSIPRSTGTSRRLGRLQIDVELPIRSFGQYVAEYESEELGDYFVQTSEFGAVVAGEARVFAGRKGTGKTATMSQVARELSMDRSILVVPMKPSSYELPGLIAAISKFAVPGHAEYFLTNIWSYLIQTEIALKAVEECERRPRSSQDEQTLDAMGTLLAHMGLAEGDDLSARLERVVDQVVSTMTVKNSSDPRVVAQALRLDQVDRLQELTLALTQDFRRIAVLIDNLDKNWEAGADFATISQFVLALLVASGRIEKRFGRSRSQRADGPVATLAVFIRTDILDVVRTYAREPDKIGVRTVDWTDEELLVRVLEERYLAKNRRKSPGIMWAELFCPEVRGLPTRDYFLWRALRRPRDFIYFANSAVTTAINRKHSLIEASDVIYAEREYSRFAFEALLVESEAINFDLEEALHEFAGVGATLASDDLDAILANIDEANRIKDWLTAASFLGVELADGKFEYVEGEVAARRKSRVALRNSTSEARPVRYRVHPAFRPYLEIRDDDLHD